jgi:N-acetylmuramoyl-L-alanine amidase
VLIECGFLSNKNELENLKDKDYQKKLSLTVFCALIKSSSQQN